MPAPQKIRETINKWDILKLKIFCKAKDMVNKTKQQPTEWEKNSEIPSYTYKITKTNNTDGP